MSLTKVSYSMIDGAPINVKDYGALPSASSAVNTLAIQAALTAALATKNAVVFEAGTYQHDGLTYVGSDLILIGKNSVLEYTGSTDAFVVSSANNTNASNLTVSNLTFKNGRSCFKVAGTGTGIYSNINISDCIFDTADNNTTNLWLEQCSETLITNNKVYNALDVGIYYSFSNNAIISNNLLVNCAGSAAISVGYENLNITSENIIIEGNEIYTDENADAARNYIGGIVYVLGSDVLISNNHISSKPNAAKKIATGIYLEQFTVSNVVISGNKIYNMLADGIRLGFDATSDMNNIEILNNQITETGLNGIYLYRSKSVKIQGNNLKYINQAGILTDSLCTDLQIIDNSFVDIGVQAIFGSVYSISSAAPNTLISGNTFVDSQLGGVIFSTVTTPTYSVDGSGVVRLYTNAVLTNTIPSAGLTWGQLATAINAVTGWTLSLYASSSDLPIQFIRRTGFRWTDNVQEYSAPNAAPYTYFGTPEPYAYVNLFGNASGSLVTNNTYKTNVLGLPNHHSNLDLFNYLSDTQRDLNRYGGGRTFNYTAIPTVGNYIVGDIVNNSAPTVGQPKAWMCTASGAPGTWVSTGNL
jgi:parallel beta-helix repeat protein